MGQRAAHNEQNGGTGNHDDDKRNSGELKEPRRLDHVSRLAIARYGSRE
jgi:hypothetical protein